MDYCIYTGLQIPGGYIPQYLTSIPTIFDFHPPIIGPSCPPVVKKLLPPAMKRFTTPPPIVKKSTTHLVGIYHLAYDTKIQKQKSLSPRLCKNPPKPEILKSSPPISKSRQNKLIIHPVLNTDL